MSEHEVTVLWCGDARALLIRGGQVLGCTRPHVYGELGVAAGMSREAAFARPQAWGIYRFLGGPSPHDIDKTPAPWRLEPGDFVVLSSMPLFRHLAEAGLGQALSSPDPAQALVHSALEQGAKGELSVIVLRRDAQGSRGEVAGAEPGSGALTLPPAEASLPDPPPAEPPPPQSARALAVQHVLTLADLRARASYPADPEVRRRALASIAPVHRLLVPGSARPLLDDQTLDELIVQGLRDHAVEVREIAARLAFVCNRGRSAEAELLRALEHEHTRWPALLALGSADGPESLAALARYAKSDDLPAASAAVRALAQRDDGLDLWREALEDPRPDVRRSADFARDVVEHRQPSYPLKMRRSYEQVAAMLRAERGVDVPWQSVVIAHEMVTVGGLVDRPLERIILDGHPLREHPEYANWLAEAQRPRTTKDKRQLTLIDLFKEYDFYRLYARAANRTD